MGAAAQEYLSTNFTLVRELKNTPQSHVTIVSDQGGSFYVLKEIKRTGLPYQDLQKLKHPALPQIYYVNETAEQTTVLEEYVNGKNLADALTLQPFSEEQVQNIASQLCKVLAFLHAHKLLHRDIKPSNIIQQPDGQIKLIDFDAARTIHDSASSDTRLLGTKGFAPPEQYGFAPTDGRSDLYALGKTMEVLLGPHYHGYLLAIIQKATQIDAAKRYQDAASLEKALQKGRKKFSLTSCLLVVGCLAALGIGLWIYNRPSPLPSKAKQEATMPSTVKLPGFTLGKKTVPDSNNSKVDKNTLQNQAETDKVTNIQPPAQPAVPEAAKPKQIFVPVKDDDFAITYSTSSNSQVLPLKADDYAHAIHLTAPQSFTISFTVTNNSAYTLEDPYLMFYPSNLAFGGTNGVDRGKASYLKLSDSLAAGETATATITFNKLALLHPVAYLLVTVISNSYEGPRGKGSLVFNDK